MPEEKAPTLDLEKTLRLMDVADTMRRTRNRVDEHLAASDREQIRAHLQERYREMGHEADPALLDEAIDSVLAEQYRFRPPSPGLGTRLAGLYVRRGKLARRFGLPLLFLGFIAFAAIVVGTQVEGFLEQRKERSVEQAAERETRETEELDRLMAAADSRLESVRELARVPGAVSNAERYHRQVAEARAAGDRVAMSGALADLTELRDRLDAEYTLSVVRGVERDNVRHYLVVEAVDAEGRPVRVNIRNEETGKVKPVSTWGERVDKAVYDAVAADYGDNRVIDDNHFGRKVRGHLEPEQRWPSRGRLTEW